MARSARIERWRNHQAVVAIEVDYPTPPSRVAELITELALLPALRGRKGA